MKSTANPLVSVVVPVYNGSDYVVQGLNSILAQSYQPIEIIVIDDGSTDDTAEKLKSFGNKITWKTIPNQGPANARNQGLNLAKGQYIAFLDCDDVWFRNKIAKQIEALAAHPDAGFCCCNFIGRRGPRNRLANNFKSLGIYEQLTFNVPVKEPFRLLMRENFIGTASNVVVRRDVLERAGSFNTKYVNAQEFEFWLRCSLKTDFVILSEMLMFKRGHPHNWSGNKKRSYSYRKLVTADTIKNNFEFLRKSNMLEECYLILARKTYQLGNIYFEEKDVKTAFSLYWEGLRTSPSPENLKMFLGIVFKKGLRLLTGDRLSREALDRLVNKKSVSSPK